MKKLLFALPLPALLAAASDGVPIRSGIWTIRTDITDLQMPGVPPMLAKMMKRPMNWAGCVTPEQAAKGPPLGTFSRNGCKVTQTADRKGGFTSHSVCTQPGGGTGTTDVTGTYTPDTFTAVAKSVQNGPRPLTMTMNMTGKRTKDC